jgi:PAS domain S-box-containing protein
MGPKMPAASVREIPLLLHQRLPFCTVPRQNGRRGTTAARSRGSRCAGPHSRNMIIAQSTWDVRRNLRELVERLPLPAALNAFDEATSVLLVNESFMRTFGYTIADIPTVGAWATRAYPDETYRRETFAAWDAAVARARAETGRVEAMEFRVTCRDGTIRDVVFGAVVAGDHLLVTFVDVSERRRAEAAIQDMQRRLEHAAYELTARIPVGTYIIAHDADNLPKFTFVSERWLRMLDLRREDVMADASLPFRAVHPDDRHVFVRSSDAAMARCQNFFWEGRIVVRGETRWVSIESKPRNRLGGGHLWEGVMIDITPRKQAEAALAAAREQERLREAAHCRDLEQKLRTSLTAAAAAHEIKQPLGRILFETQLAIERLRQTPLEPDDMEDYLGSILEASQQVVELIERTKSLLRASLPGHDPVSLALPQTASSSPECT